MGSYAPPSSLAHVLEEDHERWPKSQWRGPGPLGIAVCSVALLGLVGTWQHWPLRGASAPSRHAPDRVAAQLVQLSQRADACVESSSYPNLRLDELVLNNLGGQGPDKGPEGIIYQGSYTDGSGSGEARRVFLEVHADGGYRSSVPKMNGRRGSYGVLNLRPGTESQLRFYIANATGAPMMLPSLALTILDLDEDESGIGVEYLLAGGYDEFLLTKQTEVRTLMVHDGRTLFHASRNGLGENNPLRDPPDLSEESRAVGLLYSNIQQVNLTIGVRKPGFRMRLFMFLGRPFPCTMLVHEKPLGRRRGDSWLANITTDAGEEPEEVGADRGPGRAAVSEPSNASLLNASLQGGLRIAEGQAGQDAAPDLGAGLGGVQEGQRQMLSGGEGKEGEGANGASNSLNVAHAEQHGGAQPSHGGAGQLRSQWVSAIVLLPLTCSLLCWFSRRTWQKRARTYSTLQHGRGGPLSHDACAPLAQVRLISSQQSGDFKWSGIVAVNKQLYCVPFHAEDILTVDATSDASRAVSSRTSENGKWSGAALWKGELFFAPFNADDVLVLNLDSGMVQSIATPSVDGGAEGCRWMGIAELGGLLYCAPHNADDVLVVDPTSHETFTLPTGRTGPGKWHGIAALGGKLYCAPFNADAVLVIDPGAGAMRAIPCGRSGDWKWAGIAALGKRLYCAPHDADDVLVVDPAAGNSWTIATGRTGVWKWSGITACGGALYCAPCCADDILVVDPSARTTAGLRTGYGTGGHKWAGITAVGQRLYCAPSCADEVLVVSLGAAAVAL